MTQSTNQITLHMMEREFLLACRPEERSKLESAAEMLESKMITLRNSGSVTGIERVAMLAGLQIAVELIDLQAAKPLIEPEALRQKIRSIEDSITSAL